MAASITASRFAVLKIEDSDEETKRKCKGTTEHQKKKKSKKKSKSSEQNNLRSLAFGSAKSSHSSANNPAKVNTSTSAQQLEEWKRHDSEIVDDMYEQQLQQAILASKVEHEKQKSEVHISSASVAQADQPAPKETDKKKQKKSKKKTVSIAEFQRENSPVEKQEGHHVEQAKIGAAENFFEVVNDNAAHVIKKDKMQEEYSKQYKVQAVLNAKHNEALEERDKVIADLRNKLLEAQVELQQVKKRNKQLCHILGQGEMKDKSEILQQVESLTNIKDELTTQLATVTMEMEKEKSKVHSLQNELSKTKARGKY